MLKDVFLFCVCIKSIWSLTLEPYPTANVTRYERQTFNCSVDSNWSSVTYSYGDTNIALFFVEDGKCKEFGAPLPERYTTYCDDTSRTFYLIINNVTDYYIGKTIQCRVVYNTGAKSVSQSRINVQYAPTTLPTITQTPNGSIHEGTKVTLTCVVQGGNPLAAITWSCDGATQINPTGSPSLSETTSSVELTTTKDNNEQICACTGKHILWTKDKAQQHTLSVYYSPTVRIRNSDPLRIVENTTLELACAAQDGNPTVGSFSWYKGNSTASIGMLSNLSFTKIYRTDAGDYRCEGSNNIGQNGVDTVYVNVLYQYTTPTVVFVVCKTTSATVLWSYKSNRGSQHLFSVQYWNIQQPTQTMLSPNISDTSSGSEASFQYTIQYLLPKTKYNFQVISRNEVGNSISTTVNCTTDASISNRPEGNGLFVAGISSLVTGLLIAMFAVAVIIYFRFRQKKQQPNRSENYAEFKTYKPEEPHAYDVLSQPAGTGKEKYDLQRRPKTGGGPSPVFSAAEEIMVGQLMCGNKAELTGLPSGLDTDGTGVTDTMPMDDLPVINTLKKEKQN